MKAQPVLALALATLVAGQAGAGADATTDVSIVNFAFDPADVTVDAGDSVRWTNDDLVSHTATADGGSFDTGLIAAGGSGTLQLTTPGAFEYFCAVHPFMRAVVRVRDPNALPDLVVSGIATLETTPGVHTDVTVTVKNQANGRADASTVAVHYRYQGELVPIGTGAIGALEPGEQDTATIGWDTLGLVGDFEVVAVADAAEAVAEEDEANNAASATASVLVPGIEGTDVLAPLGL